jgi:hypothetical protein
MRKRFYSIILGFICAAFGAGMMLGIRLEVKHSAEREAEAEAVSRAINAVSLISRVYSGYDAGSEETFEKRRTIVLITELYDLACAEPFKKEHHDDCFLWNADFMLGFLAVDSMEELTSVVENVELRDATKAPFLDPSNDEYEQVQDFLQRTFAWRDAEPRRPARLWLKAVLNDDVKLLEEAFSERVRNESDDAIWAERLAAYQADLDSAYGEYEYREFGSSYTAGGNDGELRIHHKDEENRTFQIVNENDGWKIDGP